MEASGAPTQTETEFHRAALHEIITLASNLARRIHAAATETETLPLEQASIALDRTARIIRRTVLLAQRLHNLPPPPDPAATRAAARTRIIRGVEDAIHVAARTAPEREQALCAEFEERLDRPDFDRDLATRPIAELIEELARDLGVATQAQAWIWRRRTPTDIETITRKAAFSLSPKDMTRERATVREPTAQTALAEHPPP